MNSPRYPGNKYNSINCSVPILWKTPIDETIVWNPNLEEQIRSLEFNQGQTSFLGLYM